MTDKKRKDNFQGSKFSNFKKLKTPLSNQTSNFKGSNKKHYSFKQLNEDDANKTEVKKGNLKKQLRDAQRLLKKPNLSSEIKVETERKIKALILQIEESEVDKIVQENHKKYKMVMFFERKKVMRQIKQLEKKIVESEDNEETKDLELQLMEANVNLNYILHYPLQEKYISLFPNSKDENKNYEHDSVSSKKQKEIRERIKNQMVEGKLPSKPSQSYSTSTLKGKESVNDQTKDNMNSTPGLADNDDFFATSEEINEESNTNDVEKEKKSSDSDKTNDESENEDLSNSSDEESSSEEE